MTSQTPPDYLLIGHIAHDITPSGPQLGGTVSYAAYTAVAFGLRVGILTSAALDEPLLKHLPPQVEIVNIPAEHTTTFENRYTASGRIQFMYHRAKTLTVDHVPPAWKKARLVHLAPIAYEADPPLVAAFGDSPVCVTPQGWMRLRESDSRVRSIAWETAGDVLPQTRLTILSEEDIRHDPGLEQTFAQLAPLMVLTRGNKGGTVYVQGESHEYATPAVEEIDPTGAGDIFAAALNIALDRLQYPDHAIRLDRAIQIAAYLAAQSVTRRGFASAPTAAEVERAWQLYAGTSYQEAS
ncbi:MAG: ribokinase [Anaerolineae bacterium]|nr:ribokinase [Anaerolineae bacterium]